MNHVYLHANYVFLILNVKHVFLDIIYWVRNVCWPVLKDIIKMQIHANNAIKLSVVLAKQILTIACHVLVLIFLIPSPQTNVC